MAWKGDDKRTKSREGNITSDMGLALTEEEGEHTAEFVASKGLTSTEAARRLIEFGRNELEDKKIPKVCIILMLFLYYFLIIMFLF